MKFRNKLFLVLALAAAVPMVVMASLTWYVITSSHRDDIAKLESAVLGENATEIQNFIDGQLLSFPRLVVPTGVSLTIATSAQTFAMQQTMNTLSYLRSESYIDIGGKETARVDRDHPGGYPDTALADMSGSLGFQTAKNGGTYLGPVTVSATDTILTFAVPVRSNSGEVMGVIMGTASGKPIAAITGQAKIGETGYVYLVSQDGTVVGGGGPFAGGGAAAASDVEHSPIVLKALNGENLLTPETQMRYKSAAGGEVVGAGKVLSEYGNTWALIAEWPATEADAVMNGLINEYLFILAAAIAIVLVVAVLLALFIVRPIRKLEEVSARVAKGKFDEGVSIRTGDELEELGDAFNSMVIGLKEYEQLKDEFVFVAAHELRTPVAAMKGYLSLILDGTTGAISDGTRSFIEKVIGSNNRLIQLVNDLLEVARSQAGRLTIKTAPVAIAPAIAATLDELHALADEKSVTLVYAPPADLPQVLADSDRIKEVVVNLVGNAIKYMGGPGTVTITHEMQGGTLVTHVADTGLGMSKEAQEKLFQKFYRIQTDRTKDITGTGLGLFIVKEIIEKMNGTISVESEEGKGSIFSFGLPLAPAA